MESKKTVVPASHKVSWLSWITSWWFLEHIPLISIFCQFSTKVFNSIFLSFKKSDQRRLQLHFQLENLVCTSCGKTAFGSCCSLYNGIFSSLFWSCNWISLSTLFLYISNLFLSGFLSQKYGFGKSMKEAYSPVNESMTAGVSGSVENI